jgi:signal transduction histidine kinase/ligand-binding sensor domain-containing protein
MTRTRGGGYCALVKLPPSPRCQAVVSAFCVAWVLTGTAWALDPHRHVTQFGHSAWRTQDGFVNRPVAVTQTADGYVWIATRDGLVRFDGVKFSPWSPPPGESLPAPGLSALLGARDGSLWIGTTAGLSRLKDGHLFNYTTTPRSPGITVIAEDRAGTIWATRYRVNDGLGPLCRVAGERLICYGKKDGLDPPYALGLAAQPDGTLWFACGGMVCRFAAGAFTSYFAEQLTNPAGGTGATDVAVDSSGSVWAAFDAVGPRVGLQRFADGKWASFVVPGLDGSAVHSHTLFVDRQGTLWIGTESNGLYHVHDGHADHYDRSDGLSGNGIGSMFEDREGNLWVVTDRGLDMFHDTSVVTYSTIEGLVGPDLNSVLALRDGTVWVGTQEALNIIDGNGIRAIDPPHGRAGKFVAALFEDSAGRRWVGVADTVMTYEAGRFSPIAGADGRPLVRAGMARAFAEDRNGDVWALTSAGAGASGERHLFRTRDRRVVEDTPVDAIVSRPRFLATDQHDGVWIADSTGAFARLRNGRADVLVRLETPEGQVSGYNLSVDSDGSVWFATNRGLYRWLDGRISRLDSSNGLPCPVIYSAIRDDEGTSWLYARCGLLRIAASEWAGWLKASDRKVSVDVLDFADGAQPTAGSGIPAQPIVSKAADGRLWFLGGFVQVIDPRRTYVDAVPPPVHIEALVADGKSHATVAQARLPPLQRQLEIDYTALSFKLPRRVRFRYKLEGQDADWHDAGDRRQALYNDLRPATYRFRVVASNDAGVWNETGAGLDFSIAPAYYQTAWFRTLAVVMLLSLLWSAYRIRLRVIERHQAEITALNESLMKAQEQERTRIAGELHDGVMQQISALSLVLGTGKRQPEADAKKTMADVQRKLIEVGTEVRQLSHNLHPPMLKDAGLPEALRGYCEEFSRVRNIPVSCHADDSVQDLSRGAALALYRIAQEALGNAAAHGAAQHVDVRLTLSNGRVMLTVSDDGRGFDPHRIGASGGLGLINMRERARHVRIGERARARVHGNSGDSVSTSVIATRSTLARCDCSLHAAFRRNRA